MCEEWADHWAMVSSTIREQACFQCLPVAAYLTWQGQMLENNGIVPKFCIEPSREALREERDSQLEKAIDVAKTL